MIQETTVENAASQLAEAIKNAPEWKRFTAINAEFENDETVSKMLEEYQALANTIQSGDGDGNGQPSPEQARQLESLQVRIQSSPLFAQREEAAQSMLAVLEQANVAVSNELGLNFAANAAPRQGCCGGH